MHDVVGWAALRESAEPAILSGLRLHGLRLSVVSVRQTQHDEVVPESDELQGITGTLHLALGRSALPVHPQKGTGRP
jgi:hypothetical protein